MNIDQETEMNIEKKNLNADLSYEIIGAAIEVHKNLGPGLLESAYESCLALGLLINFNVSLLSDGIKRFII